MKQLLVRGGRVVLEEVPAPACQPGMIIVRTGYSVISSGTEVAAVKRSGKSLLQRARDEPQRVRRVLDMAATYGIPHAVNAVRARLELGGPLGYSVAGVVESVGSAVTDLRVGDRVACAGAGIANHAEWIAVPRLLAARVPQGVSTEDAAFATIGAIALQGVRRCGPALGDRVAVLGLGIIGQFTAQLLAASGAEVLAFDVDPDRAALAGHDGASHSASSEQDLVNLVRSLTVGVGVDAVIITAATPSDQPLNDAMKICRRKGRVVVVGDVGLALERSPFYEKEIDLLISCSYGPGRYDIDYEERGIDYPLPYVRWTENRNMEEFLRCLEHGAVRLGPLAIPTVPIDDASRAFGLLQAPIDRPLAVRLSYAHDSAARPPDRILRFTPRASQGRIRVAVIGVGNFALAVHLPLIKSMADTFDLYGVAARTGHKVASAAKLFGAQVATTSAEELIGDPNVDAVFIDTRHSSHADLAIAAARAGKAIYLEKPMGLHETEIDRLAATIRETRVPFVVGFNRRFSPSGRRAKEILAKRGRPFVASYRMNLGGIPERDWILGPEGGGRIVGEACHLVDFLLFLAGAPIQTLTLTPGPDRGDVNAILNVTFADSSVATVVYTALGPSTLDKERCEVFAGDVALVLDDHRALTLFGSDEAGWSGPQDKGWKDILEAFAHSVRHGTPLIPLDDLVDVAKRLAAFPRPQ